MSDDAPQPTLPVARHSIAAVARRTGLTQLVLRAWERRYGAVTPARTPTGRRLYTEQDVEKLILLQRLTAAGHRIGDIAGLALPALRKLAAETGMTTLDDAPATTTTAAEHLHGALEAVGAMDARRLREILESALRDLSKPALRNELLTPLLSEIGQRWSEGNLRVAHEHMASSIVASFLTSLNARQNVPTGAPLLAVATPTHHRHELGALLAAAVALEVGWDVLFLGADLPAEDLAAAVHERGARAVLLSLVYPQGDPVVAGELRRLRRLVGPETPILAGGRALSSYAEALAGISAIPVSDEATLIQVLAQI